MGNGYLEAIAGAKEINKTLTGRWKITIVEMTPTRKDMATSVEEIRKGGGSYAVKLLKHGAEMRGGSTQTGAVEHTWW